MWASAVPRARDGARARTEKVRPVSSERASWRGSLRSVHFRSVIVIHRAHDQVRSYGTGGRMGFEPHC